MDHLAPSRLVIAASPSLVSHSTNAVYNNDSGRLHTIYSNSLNDRFDHVRQSQTKTGFPLAG